MVSQAKGRLFKRKDGKYLIYVPKSLAEDSMFPFTAVLSEAKRKGEYGVPVKITFSIGGEKLIIEKWEEE